ncbi:MAG: Abi family protein [Bacilli bacterium]|nr:Abi family protein [Bacilli bacterium]
MQKDFRTIDEQVEILQKKGLIVEDIDEAKEVLLRENYFFLNGYRHLFMVSEKNRTFIKGSTFRELYSLFLFDRYFRNIIFKNVLVIENQLKSILSYQLSKKYGYKEKDYLNPKNFTNDHDKKRRVKDVLEKMKRQIRINSLHHNATAHYANSYGYIPLWVLVKVLSFGIVCELYTILKKEDKIEIADIFNTTPEDLSNYLIILSNYRNLCAHEDIVYENKTERYIEDNIYHEELNIPKMDAEYIYGKNDLFAVIIIFKILLTDDSFRLMLKEIEYEIEKLDGRIDSIPIEKILDRMGFPTNYMDIIDL